MAETENILPDLDDYLALQERFEAGEFSVDDLAEEGWAQEADSILSELIADHAAPEITQEFIDALTDAATDAGNPELAASIKAQIEALNMLTDQAAENTELVAQTLLETVTPLIARAVEDSPLSQEDFLAPLGAIAGETETTEIDSALADSLSRRLAELMVADISLGGALSAQVADLKQMIALAASGQPIPAGMLESASFTNIATALHTAQTGGASSASEQALAQKQTAQAIEDMIVAQTYSITAQQAHYVAQLESEYMRESAAHFIHEGYEAQTVVYTVESITANTTYDLQPKNKAHAQLIVDATETSLEIQKDEPSFDIIREAVRSAPEKTQQDIADAPKTYQILREQLESLGVPSKTLDLMPKDRADALTLRSMQNAIDLIKADPSSSTIAIESLQYKLSENQHLQKRSANFFATVGFDKMPEELREAAYARARELGHDPTAHDFDIRDIFTADQIKDIATRHNAAEKAGTLTPELATDYALSKTAIATDTAVDELAKASHILIEKGGPEAVKGLYTLFDHSIDPSVRAQSLANMLEVDLEMAQAQVTKMDKYTKDLTEEQRKNLIERVDQTIVSAAAINGATLEEQHDLRSSLNDARLAAYKANVEQGHNNYMFGHGFEDGLSKEEVDELVKQQERDARIEGRAALIQFNADPSKYGPDSDVFRNASEYEMLLREEAAMRRDPSLRMENGAIHPNEFNRIYDTVDTSFAKRHETAVEANRLEEVQRMLDVEPIAPTVTETGVVTLEGDAVTGAGGQSLGALDENGAATTDLIANLKNSGVTSPLQSTTPEASEPFATRGGMSTAISQADDAGLSSELLSMNGGSSTPAPRASSTAAVSTPASSPVGIEEEAAAAAPATPIQVAAATPAATTPPSPPATPNALPANDPAITGPV